MSKIQLTAEQKKQLKATAHALNPVVIISENGLSANVIKEIDNNLNAHELIKIRVFGDDKNLRQQYLEEICQKLNCAAVQTIGKILVVYRQNPNKQKNSANSANSANSKSGKNSKNGKKLSKRDYQND